MYGFFHKLPQLSLSKKLSQNQNIVMFTYGIFVLFLLFLCLMHQCIRSSKVQQKLKSYFNEYIYICLSFETVNNLKHSAKYLFGRAKYYTFHGGYQIFRWSTFVLFLKRNEHIFTNSVMRIIFYLFLKHFRVNLFM